MKISRSIRASEVLKSIVESKQSRTIYGIQHSLLVEPVSKHKTKKSSLKKKTIPVGSLIMALDNLIKKNLIKLDIEMSRKKGRNAKIYIPTFKGLLVFLANYPFPTGACLLYTSPSPRDRS